MNQKCSILESEGVHLDQNVSIYNVFIPATTEYLSTGTDYPENNEPEEHLDHSSVQHTGCTMCQDQT